MNGEGTALDWIGNVTEKCSNQKEKS